MNTDSIRENDLLNLKTPKLSYNYKKRIANNIDKYSSKFIESGSTKDTNTYSSKSTISTKINHNISTIEVEKLVKTNYVPVTPAQLKEREREEREMTRKNQKLPDTYLKKIYTLNRIRYYKNKMVNNQTNNNLSIILNESQDRVIYMDSISEKLTKITSPENKDYVKLRNSEELKQFGIDYKTSYKFIKEIHNTTFRQLKYSRKNITLNVHNHKNLPVLILDLDETLIHNMKISDKNIDPIYDYCCGYAIKGRIETFTFRARHYLFELLNWAVDKFELVLFTASVEEYATAIIKELRIDQYFSTILTRNSVNYIPFKKDKYVLKDLHSIVNRDILDILIVDNNISTYANNLANGIPIKSFKGEKDDSSLISLKTHLEDMLKFSKEYSNGKYMAWYNKITWDFESYLKLNRKFDLEKIIGKTKMFEIMLKMQENGLYHEYFKYQNEMFKNITD